MTCRACKTYLDHWLQEQLGSNILIDDMLPIAPQVADHLSTCHGCATYYETIKMVFGTSDNLGVQATPIPAGMEDRISASVLERIQRDEDVNSKFKKRNSHFYKYVMAAAVLAMVLLPFVGRQDSGFKPTDNVGAELAQVRLEIEAPHAESVVVVGDWNNWDTQSHYLARGDQGETWSIEMELEQGKEYRYQFVIDGERWIADPNAYLQVDDGFGGINSVLEM
ncbi:hypothetical protein [Pleomorphochaeta sp. DL1XJH-081]|uniref:hypothetical protein n=1 Tax=Pleomorphochaeta sp. DL1XJH-081 TaxID=3409690 RepID=UPI003BB6B6C9